MPEASRSPPRSTHASAGGCLARLVLSLVFVALLVGAALARLARVARPRFVADAALAASPGRARLEAGGVELVRPGDARGPRLGWSLRCGDRELRAGPGARYARELRAAAEPAGATRVCFARAPAAAATPADAPECLLVDATTCTVVNPEITGRAGLGTPLDHGADMDRLRAVRREVTARETR